jgi:HK97 family phage portal protein
MRRPYKAAIVGGSYKKAVTLRDFDNFLDWLVDEEGNDAGPQELYKAVSWVYWCVGQRAGAIAQVPYHVFPMELEEDDEDAAVEFGIDLRPTLWLVEAWLKLKGAAYVHKQITGSRPELIDQGNGYAARVGEPQILDKLKVLNANTMKVKEWNDDGPTLFEQKVGMLRKYYTPEELLYFRTFNPKDDINEGTSSGQAGQDPASLIHNANQWASAFFDNGAIPAVLLTTDGTMPPGAKNNVQNAWEKMFAGVRRAFKTVVLERGLTPTVIGQPVKDLAMPDLEKAKKEQILAANGLPIGLAEPKTNRAEREALQEELWTQYIIPDMEVFIEPILNEQLFNELGLRVSFQYKELEALQRMEIAKAESMAFTISGVILPAYKENTVSVDEVRSWIDSVGLAAGLPPLDETFEPEERTPPALQPFAEGEESTDEGAPTPMDERVESRTGGKAESALPKAPAPQWGHLTVSLQNSAGGETKQPNEAK